MSPPKKTPSLQRFEAYCAKREEIKALREFIDKLDAKRAEALKMIAALEMPKQEMIEAAKEEQAAKSQSRRELLATADTVKAPHVRRDTPGTMESVNPPSVSQVLPKQPAVLVWNLEKESK